MESTAARDASRRVATAGSTSAAWILSKGTSNSRRVRGLGLVEAGMKRNYIHFRMDPLLTLSATDLARRIRCRELTSADVVRAHVTRTREVNGVLNALVRDRFDAAMEEAREADAVIARGVRESLPPFHGVPCTIK